MATFYGTLAEADQYNADKGNAEWADASTSDRLAALFRASSYLDATYGNRFVGTRVSYDQDLAWPRVGVVTIDGFNIPTDAIPKGIRNAAYELAGIELSTPGRLTPVVVGSEIIKREKIDVIETEYAVPANAADLIAASNPSIAVVDGMLKPFLHYSISAIMVV